MIDLITVSDHMITAVLMAGDHQVHEIFLKQDVK